MEADEKLLLFSLFIVVDVVVADVADISAWRSSEDLAEDPPRGILFHDLIIDGLR